MLMSQWVMKLKKNWGRSLENTFQFFNRLIVEKVCFFVSILDFVYFITELMFTIFPVLFPYLTLSTLLTLTVCRTRFTQFMKLVLSLFTLVSLCGKRSERKIRKSMNWFLVKNPNFLFLSTYSFFQSQTPSSTYCWTEALGCWKTPAWRPQSEEQRSTRTFYNP